MMLINWFLQSGKLANKSGLKISTYVTRRHCYIAVTMRFRVKCISLHAYVQYLLALLSTCVYSLVGEILRVMVILLQQLLT